MGGKGREGGPRGQPGSQPRDALGRFMPPVAGHVSPSGAHERQVGADLVKQYGAENVLEKVAMRPLTASGKLDSGTNVIVDYLVRDRRTGKVYAVVTDPEPGEVFGIEAKTTTKARRFGQDRKYKLIAAHGAEIRTTKGWVETGQRLGPTRIDYRFAEGTGPNPEVEAERGVADRGTGARGPRRRPPPGGGGRPGGRGTIRSGRGTSQAGRGTSQAGRGTSAPRGGPGSRAGSGRARRRPTPRGIARFRTTKMRDVIRRRLRTVSTRGIRFATRAGAAVGRGGFAFFKGLLVDLVVTAVLSFFFELVAPERKRVARMIDAKMPKIEEALIQAYMKSEQWMRWASTKTSAGFEYVLTLGYVVSQGQDLTAGQEFLEEIKISGEEFNGERLPDVIIQPRGTPRVRPENYLEELRIDVDFENLWEMPLDGVWRMFRVTEVRGFMQESDLSNNEFTIEQLRGGISLTGQERLREFGRPPVDSGPEIAVSDVLWDREPLALTFTYYERVLNTETEIAYDATLLRTEADLFEGTIHPSWEGAKPYEVTLRRVSRPGLGYERPKTRVDELLDRVDASGAFKGARPQGSRPR